jgi:hypothetical protein
VVADAVIETHYVKMIELSTFLMLQALAELFSSDARTAPVFMKITFELFAVEVETTANWLCQTWMKTYEPDRKKRIIVR